jgi:hypothetical protein
VFDCLFVCLIVLIQMIESFPVFGFFTSSASEVMADFLAPSPFVTETQGQK